MGKPEIVSQQDMKKLQLTTPFGQALHINYFGRRTNCIDV